jgi:hypothetical protein
MQQSTNDENLHAISGHVRRYSLHIRTWHGYMNNIQWNLSNLTHQGTREICRIVQDFGILNFLHAVPKFSRQV